MFWAWKDPKGLLLLCRLVNSVAKSIQGITLFYSPLKFRLYYRRVANMSVIKGLLCISGHLESSVLVI